MREWTTEENDLQLAEKIIDKYLDYSGGEPLGIFELEIGNGESMDFRLSDWICELHDQFESLYGQEQGDSVTRKVVSRCLTVGETLH